MDNESSNSWGQSAEQKEALRGVISLQRALRLAPTAGESRARGCENRGEPPPLASPLRVADPSPCREPEEPLGREPGFPPSGEEGLLLFSDVLSRKARQQALSRPSRSLWGLCVCVRGRDLAQAFPRGPRPGNAYVKRCPLARSLDQA